MDNSSQFAPLNFTSFCDVIKLRKGDDALKGKYDNFNVLLNKKISKSQLDCEVPVLGEYFRLQDHRRGYKSAIQLVL